MRLRAIERARLVKKTYPHRVSLEGLVVRARAGEAAARDQLLATLYADVRKHVFFVLHDAALADDAVQETMIAVHRGLDGFRGDASPRTWALAIATRVAHRLRRRETRYVATEAMPDVGCFDVDQRGAAELVALRRLLATLAPKKRDAFVLIAILELSAEEAGRVLGTFANTAASRYRHARAELEHELGDGAVRAPFPRAVEADHG
jgi:RNA polymerase sigma-70 factor (ECF subfamily)